MVVPSPADLLRAISCPPHHSVATTSLAKHFVTER
jgi:hypothetical protein